MKTQQTTRYVRCVALLMAMLCGLVYAQPDFFDDFSDGDLTDGSPMNWIPFDEGPSAHSGAMVANADGTYYTCRDVSISAQIKRIPDHSNGEWVSGLLSRWSSGPTGGYWIEVRAPNRFLFGHRDRYILRSATLPFDVDETELIIRVDAVGDQLKAWCWPADESMPEEPQISLVDNVAPEGPVGFYYSNQGGEAIYRWVKVESLDVPIVDFNGDGTVDIKDLLKMIDCWGQNEPSVDLSSNGTVGEEDLEILMTYWQQDVNDPTLLAHWALDETEGDIACDSAGFCDAVLVGDPVWDPDGGYIEGALQLDGVDDYAVTPFVVNPREGPFSVFAWIKGGVPAQTVISQADGTDWLQTDATEGRLMTCLSNPDNRMPALPLVSDTIVADNEWHRIGLVCDGMCRALYVDEVLAAEDAQSTRADCQGGLNIGCGTDAGGLFCGRIDDVRVYNRAVKP